MPTMAFVPTSNKFSKCTWILVVTQLLVFGIIYLNNNSFWELSKSLARGFQNLPITKSNGSQQIWHNPHHNTDADHTNTTGIHSVQNVIQLAEGWDNGDMYSLRIAIGLGLTTRKLVNFTTDTLDTSLVFYRSLMTSFCLTCSPGYEYHFFLAYDHDDPYMSQQTFRANFELVFERFTSRNCNIKSRYFVRLVECNHSGKPTWAQNDAMIEAYLDGMDYFYRVNDDTIMTTGAWTEIFIRELNKMRPPRVGVVGPNHSGGNLRAMTYDFVHRTHVEIHGFYYPRHFRDWGAGAWITDVYKPNNSLKVRKVKLVHTKEKGTRYNVTRLPKKDVDAQTTKDMTVLVRYVGRITKGFKTPDPRKVIAMSLCRNDSADVWGALRNAQLAPVIFPGWTVKFYILHTLVDQCVKREILKILVDLGAKIEIISTNETILPLALNYIVADDPSVDVFLLRNPRERLSERDFAAVSDWLARENENEVVHCLKDHPKFIDFNMVNGQWGAKSRGLWSKLRGITIVKLLSNFTSTHSNISLGRENAILDAFLNASLWDLVKYYVLCHDSVSCDRRGKGNILAFPVKRRNKKFIGQIFDCHEWLDTTKEVQPNQLDNSTECIVSV